MPDLPIAGVQFFHQMMPFEFTVGGPVFAVSSTDTLRLTVGSF